MFCQNCGTPHSDNALFCKNCGASLATQPVAQQEAETTSLNNTVVSETPVQQEETQNTQGYQQFNYQPQNNLQADYQVKDYDQTYQKQQQQDFYQSYQQAYEKKPKVYSTNPVINAVKKAASSGVFLAGVICFTVYLVLSFFNLFQTSTSLSTMMGLFEILDIPRSAYLEIQEALSSMSGIIVFSGIIGLIPTGFALLGSWLTFGAGKNRNSDRMNTSGLGMIKAITVLQLVFYCIGIGLSVILAIISMVLIAAGVLSSGGRIFTSSSYGYGYNYNGGNVSSGIESALPLILVFVFIILAVVFIFTIIFYAKTIKTLNCIKRSAENGFVTGSISMFLIVVLFIYAVTSLFALSMAGLVCTAMYVLFAISLIMLRKEFKRLEFEQFQQEKINQAQDAEVTNM